MQAHIHFIFYPLNYKYLLETNFLNSFTIVLKYNYFICISLL